MLDLSVGVAGVEDLDLDGLQVVTRVEEGCCRCQFVGGNDAVTNTRVAIKLPVLGITLAIHDGNALESPDVFLIVAVIDLIIVVIQQSLTRGKEVVLFIVFQLRITLLQRH